MRAARWSLTNVPPPLQRGDLLAILPGIRADLERQLNPDNRDFTFRNLDLNKTGTELVGSVL